MYRGIVKYYEKDNTNVFIISIPRNACVWTIADRE